MKLMNGLAAIFLQRTAWHMGLTHGAKQYTSFVNGILDLVIFQEENVKVFNKYWCYSLTKKRQREAFGKEHRNRSSDFPCVFFSMLSNCFSRYKASWIKQIIISSIKYLHEIAILIINQANDIHPVDTIMPFPASKKKKEKEKQI